MYIHNKYIILCIKEKIIKNGASCRLWMVENGFTLGF